MKVFAFFITLSILSMHTFSKKQKFEKLAECMLSMQVNGLQYISLTETVELKLVFESNCKDYLHHAFFVIPFSKVYEIDYTHHPRAVVLRLAGEEFRMNFIEPVNNGNRFLFPAF